MHVKTNKSFFLIQKGQKSMFNFKLYAEKRAEYVKKMQDIMDAAEVEERAMTDEEETEFNDLENKIKRLDRTVDDAKRARDLIIDKNDPAKTEEKRSQEEVRASERRAFENYIRGVLSEDRAAGDLVEATNGAVVPTSIAKDIIKVVKNMSPIYALAKKYPIKGNLVVPYYDETTTAITVAYSDETEELLSKSGKFTSIELKDFLAGALAKVPKRLINNSQFDLTGFIIQAMGEALTEWVESKILTGAGDGKIECVSKAKQVVTAAAQSAITADELIDLQEEVPDKFQPKCIWIMSKKTRTAIRKLKNSDGDYILQKDATAKWGYTLFGADVYCSDAMPDMGADKTAIVYGDMSGIVVKITEDMTVEVLRERFATQHCIGVMGWIDVDAKIAEEQKIAVLKMAA